jgi:hypothetical protein
MKQLDLGKTSSTINRAIGLKKSSLKIIKRKNKNKKNGSPKPNNYKR